MTNANQNLPENYIQEMLETYADGLEKHKDNNKALLVELLKASDNLGKRIDTFQDYEALQTTVAEMEANGNLSGLQKLGIKKLRTFIETNSKLFPQSPETQNQYISGAYIDDLIEKNNLAKKSREQLTTIKSLLSEHNTQIDPKRLTIKNNLVCIDGYTLPTGVTTQNYNKMKNDPEGLTYPGYAEALLNFTADITGERFTFPANRDKLQKGEIDGKAFYQEINTPENQAIIKTLYSIVGFDSVIPVGLDKDGYVIYAIVRSGDGCGFFRFNFDMYNVNDACLVSAA